MKNLALFSLILASLYPGVVLAQTGASANKITWKIDSKWKFRQQNVAPWYTAVVPGCVHTDLLDNKLIEDPYYRVNETMQQWIGEKNWEYQTVFTAPAEVLRRDNVRMIFNGLDTYADVYLNGELILKADNMFRVWPVEVKQRLKDGENTLHVVFRNVFDENLPKWKSAPFRLQAASNNDQADVQINMYSRKAGYEFGWDWGPRLITSGIWKPVTIEAWNDAKIESVHVIQNAVSKERAALSFVLEVHATKAMDTKVEVALSDGRSKVSKSVRLVPGTNSVTVDLEVSKPRLWWTNGLGEPYLYNATAQLSSGKQVLDAATQTVGIRRVRVVREKDKIGESLYIELNGVPVFMKGANYIPLDNFINRVTPERYEYIIKSAADVHMNMLRVWGGGFYENDIFYDLCDRYGILVWQDIMFACAMYPGDKAFLDNVRNEVIDNVKRLRNHPSIALYNGNNEIDAAWHSWGWKQQYPEDVRKVAEADLYTLFRDVIPAAIKEADPDVYYHPTSPNAGFSDFGYETGDIHYWGVWHGKDPFSDFGKHIARFVSEYGFQSYPDFSTIQKFSIEDDWDTGSPVMQSHQRCMGDNRRDKDYGNRLIKSYMEAGYKMPTDFRDFVYLSHIVQADGIKAAIEAHRRNMKDQYCMGTLYWQINDCWPVASWSSIDYYGNWKALHYYTGKLYQDVILSALEEKGEFRVYAVSDRLKSLQGAALDIIIRDMKGNVIRKETVTKSVPANTSTVVYSSAADNFFNGIDRKNHFAEIRLTHGGKTLYTELKSFVSMKEVELIRPQIIRKLSRSGNTVSIAMRSDVLAKNVYLFLEDSKGIQHYLPFSDNYFDLLPGEEKVVTVVAPTGDLETDLKILTMRDTYE